MRDMLLMITGMSPQVITETLYAIAVSRQPWPERVVVMTTTKGADLLRRDMIDKGRLESLCEQLHRPAFYPATFDIQVIHDAAGQPMEDARTSADHEAMADFILEIVRSLTADPATRVHASISGGRKTMSFYLGYAMSLFGRPQDVMTHVLVSEGYEGHPDFFFPTRHSCEISTRDGKTLDMKDAAVTLASIPFIRHRDELPQVYTVDKGRPPGFRELVELMDLANQPGRLGLRFDHSTGRLSILEDGRPVKELIFEKGLDWAWYLLVAEATAAGDGTLRRAETRDDGSYALGWRVMDVLGHRLGIHVDRHEDYKSLVRYWARQHEEALERIGIIPDNFLKVMQGGFSGEAISGSSSRINQQLHRELPRALADWLRIGMFFDRSGRHHAEEKRAGGYGVRLPAEQILIVKGSSASGVA